MNLRIALALCSLLALGFASGAAADHGRGGDDGVTTVALSGTRAGGDGSAQAGSTQSEPAARSETAQQADPGEPAEQAEQEAEPTHQPESAQQAEPGEPAEQAEQESEPAHQLAPATETEPAAQSEPIAQAEPNEPAEQAAQEAPSAQQPAAAAETQPAEAADAGIQAAHLQQDDGPRAAAQVGAPSASVHGSKRSDVRGGGRSRLHRHA